MGKKEEYIRIRSDEELKRALKAAAERSDRKEADQTRYLLRLALGLVDAEKDVKEIKARIAQMGTVESSAPRKGGHSR
jgi:ribosomal protein L29